MARQIGLIKLTGTLGDLTFYKGRTREGTKALARTKGGVDGDTIASSPNFQRTRENGQEFGRAASNGKLIREAFGPQLLAVSDPTIVYRLVRELRRVIGLDNVNARGERQILPEQLPNLVGFQFNEGTKLDTALAFNIASVFATPNINFNIPAHVPAVAIREPMGATHYRLRVAGAAFNFGSDLIKTNNEAFTDFIPVNEVAEQPALPLSVDLSGAVPAEDLMLGIISVEFYQEVNGNFYLLSNGAYTPMEVVIGGVFA